MKLTLSLVLAVLLSGCASSLPRETRSPEAVVQAMMDAFVRKDAKAAGALFSAHAPAEFAALRDGTVSDRDMDGAARLFLGAQIVGVEIAGERAVVRVEGGARDERIEVVYSPRGWLILDF